MSAVLSAALPAALAGLAAPALAAPLGGRAEVGYLHPSRFSDLGQTPYERQQAMATLTAFLQSLARQLPAGRTLEVQFTDIDLAGRLLPLGTREVRVLTGRADWPRLDLRYTLTEGGRTLASGRADLADLDYLANTAFLDPRLGELPYEKRLLQRWFTRTFVAS
ncbi:MAG: DUF3016 domain-containing protein [Burkholderiales bacterium]|nr:DUF3016 domain-containing protein [Burkholderiales bacterium]